MSIGSQPKTDETSRKLARQHTRFKSCVLVFAVMALLTVGIPVGIGLTRYMRQRSEAEFVDILRKYGQAQGVFHSKDRDGDKKLEYCRKIVGLVGIETGEGAEIADDELLVNKKLAAARGSKGQPLGGYLFLEMRTIWKIPINWEGDYAICAIPARYGEDGKKTYIMKTDGDIWSKDLGKSEFLRDYPQDLEAGGWARFEEAEKDE